MPISTDRFDEIDDGGPKSGTTAHEILSFHEAHADKAFTQSEIAEETGINGGSVGPTLVRLREDGRVDLRGTYWRVSDHVCSLNSSADHAGGAAASHEETPFEYDEGRSTRSIRARIVNEAYRRGAPSDRPKPR